MANCEQCRQLLFDNNIFNKKDFLKWSVKGGHPDKGGNYKKFQEVSSCNDDFFGINKKCYGDIRNTGRSYTYTEPGTYRSPTYNYTYRSPSSYWDDYYEEQRKKREKKE